MLYLRKLKTARQKLQHLQDLVKVVQQGGGPHLPIDDLEDLTLTLSDEQLEYGESEQEEGEESEDDDDDEEEEEEDEENEDEKSEEENESVDDGQSDISKSTTDVNCNVRILTTIIFLPRLFSFTIRGVHCIKFQDTICITDLLYPLFISGMNYAMAV